MHITNKSRLTSPKDRTKAGAGRFSGQNDYVTNAFYGGKPWVDPSREKLMQGFKCFSTLICNRRVMMAFFAARSSVC